MRLKRMTPEQERVFEQTEILHTRAKIFEIGVAEFLKGHMPSASETEVAADILNGAVRIRKQAAQLREDTSPSVCRPHRRKRSKKSRRESGTASSTSTSRARSTKKKESLA